MHHYYTGQNGSEFLDIEKPHLNTPPLNLKQSKYSQYCYDATWTLAYALNKTIYGTLILMCSDHIMHIHYRPISKFNIQQPSKVGRWASVSHRELYLQQCCCRFIAHKESCGSHQFFWSNCKFVKYNYKKYFAMVVGFWGVEGGGGVGGWVGGWVGGRI